MDTPNPKSTAQFMGHPSHPALVPFPIAKVKEKLLS
jgi:uncharacterized membrane protein